MCVLMLLYFLLTRSTGLLMEDGTRARVLGVGMVVLNFTLGKTMQLKNVQHILSIKKNLFSGFLLCRDGYKIVFE